MKFKGNNYICSEGVTGCGNFVRGLRNIGYIKCYVRTTTYLPNIRGMHYRILSCSHSILYRSLNYHHTSFAKPYGKSSMITHLLNLVLKSIPKRCLTDAIIIAYASNKICFDPYLIAIIVLETFRKDV